MTRPRKRPVDARERLLDYLDQGKVTPEPQAGYYDAGRDVYVLPPPGRGWRQREIQGDVGRAIIAAQGGMVDEIAARVSRIKVAKPHKLPSVVHSLCTVATVHDLHVGAYAHSLTSGRSGDIASTLDALSTATYKLLARHRSIGAPSRFIVAMFGDWFHVDNPRLSTTRGTQQSAVGDFAQIADAAVGAAFGYVEALRTLAPVELVFGGGNHDLALSTVAYAAMARAYADHDDVIVRKSYSSRQYYLWGSSLLAMHHGDKLREPIAVVAANEAPAFWSASRYRYSFHGHLHHEVQRRESGGVISHQSSSLAFTDEYHFGLGYVHSERKMTAFVIDEAEGRVFTIDAKP